MTRLACLAAVFGFAPAAVAQIALPAPTPAISIPQPEQAPAAKPAPAKLPMPTPAPAPAATLPGTVVPQYAVSGSTASCSWSPHPTAPTVGPVTITCDGKVTGCPTQTCGRRSYSPMGIISRLCGNPDGCETACPAPVAVRAPVAAPAPTCATGPRVVVVRIPVFVMGREKPCATAAGGCGQASGGCWDKFKAWVCFTPNKGGLPFPKATPYQAPLRTYFHDKGCTGCPTPACPTPGCAAKPAAACATASKTMTCTDGVCTTTTKTKLAGMLGLKGHTKPCNASSVDGEMGDGLRFAHPTRTPSPTGYGTPATMPPAAVDPQPTVTPAKYTRPFTNP